MKRQKAKARHNTKTRKVPATRNSSETKAVDPGRRNFMAHIRSWGVLAAFGAAGGWYLVEEVAATIAEHYDLGGKSEVASGYWEKAARRALAANALRDAVKMADRALTFAENQKDAFARATLLDEVWGAPFYGDPKTLDVHVRRLREKIESEPHSPRWIVTVRGLGYKFADDGAEDGSTDPP